jgi:hypothetical protein
VNDASFVRARKIPARFFPQPACMSMIVALPRSAVELTPLELPEFVMSNSMLRVFAAAILFIPLAAAADSIVCVTNVTDFQTALTNAQGSTSATYIEVARGTYAQPTGRGSALTFDSTAANQGQLDITGGYNGDCTAQIQNPALTVLDANGAPGVLSLTSQAGISVRYLTIQGGANATPGGTGGLLAFSTEGPVIIDYNIIRNNYSGTDAGVFAIVDDSNSRTNIRVNGNLITNNLSSNLCAAGGTDNHGGGSTDVINNTIAYNTSQASTLAGGFCTSSYSFVSNNIAWGNSTYDLSIVGMSFNNDCGTMQNESEGCETNGSLNLDPQFSSVSDFHLLPTSPLLGQGTLMPDTYDGSPDYGLPTIDIEGHPRSYNGFVDMGAYERGDEIYGNDFDH